MKTPFIVGDKYRTNDLSLIPGGYNVTTLYADGSSRLYSNIKNPDAYINMIKRKDPLIIKTEISKS
jgi:hypothetical protein